MPNPRPSGLGTTFLVAGVLLLLVAAGVCGLVPLVTCPECATPMDRLALAEDRDKEEARANREGKTVRASPLCMRCRDTRKVPLFRKLAHDLRAGN